MESPIRNISAFTIRESLVRGEISATELAGKLTEYIRSVDGDIFAFNIFSPDYVIAQAELLDSYKMTGCALGALHGVPVVLKDIIDTVDHPTENGISLDSGRIGRKDAFLVSKLRQAGALILGKGRSTPLAYLDPAITRNPLSLDRSPGGSSSGCAAAVAAYMSPLAIGTQTGGSVIRPASFCGVIGFKPSFGLISRSGILPQAPSLDTVGLMAQTLDDVAMLADVLIGFDASDPATKMMPYPECLKTSRERAPVSPMFAFLGVPHLDRCQQDMLDAFDELLNVLGEKAFYTNLPRAFEEAVEARRTINLAELSKCYHKYYRAQTSGDVLPDKVKEAIEFGRTVTAHDYLAALDWKKIIDGALEEIFDRADVLVCPAAPGEATEYGDVGDPIFNGLWTFTGNPVISLPLFEGNSGMPMGLQLVGQINDDARLLRSARWLMDFLGNETGESQ